MAMVRSIAVIMPGPSNLEQLLLELVNETRADPLASADRYLSSYAPLRSSDATIQTALDFFRVDGAALRDAFERLTPVDPVAWNDNLADAARAHSQLMINQQQQSHQLPGEAGLGDRVTAAGYTGWQALSENIYAYAEGMVYAHAGFMVDWGSGPNGMQDPAGHRLTIMNGSYREVGMGVLTEDNAPTQIGPYVVTQDFGARAGSGHFLMGVAYSDSDRDGFYSPGEGRSDLIVAAGQRNAAGYASGGYQLGGLSGMMMATLSGGGLSGPVQIGFNADAGNLKADIIDGGTLKLWNAGTASVAGALRQVVLAGAEGARVTLTGGQDMRVEGGTGNDTLSGSAEHEAILGGAGSDSLSGGGGNDHLYGRAPSAGADGADIIFGGDGSDYLQGNAGRDTLSGGAGSDRIQGGADADLIHGDDGADTINGNREDDEIHGDAGNDVVRGGQGTDRLFGGTGDDVLMGDLGDDRISGGAGFDLMTGGAGADLFLIGGSGDAAFTLSGPWAGWTDVIVDFTDGADRLDTGFRVQAVLQGEARADLAAAAAAAQALVASNAGDSEVAVIAVGGATYLFFASVGSGSIDSAIRLDGIAPGAIDPGDFV